MATYIPKEYGGWCLVKIEEHAFDLDTSGRGAWKEIPQPRFASVEEIKMRLDATGPSGEGIDIMGLPPIVAHYRDDGSGMQFAGITREGYEIVRQEEGWGRVFATIKRVLS